MTGDWTGASVDVEAGQQSQGNVRWKEMRRLRMVTRKKDEAMV
jgi:hypothetical protein